MDTIVKLEGKAVHITTSRAADKALAERETGLLAEMELYYSCLIRKKVRFYDAGTRENETCAADNLNVRFRPVMTANCPIDFDGEVPVQDFPIKNPAICIPRWLRIDFRRGKWIGEFGYD